VWLKQESPEFKLQSHQKREGGREDGQKEGRKEGRKESVKIIKRALI
jgi:hypothetical protein